MYSFLTTAIGRIVSERREQKQLSLQALVQMSELPARDILRIERGNVDIDIESLCMIADALGTDVITIVNDAQAADWQRILVIGAASICAGLLSNGRQIMLIDSLPSADEFLESTRVDCVILAAKHAANMLNVMERASKYNNQCQFILLLEGPEDVCDVPDGVRSCRIEDVTGFVDAIIAETVRGQVSLMRERLAAMDELKCELEKQHREMLLRVNRLFSLRTRIAKQSRSAAPGGRTSTP